MNNPPTPATTLIEPIRTISRLGDEEYRLDGVLHRVEGPAVILGGGPTIGGAEEWFKHGLRHRQEGPAVQSKGGVINGGSEEWWINGIELNAQEVEERKADIFANRFERKAVRS